MNSFPYISLSQHVNTMSTPGCVKSDGETTNSPPSLYTGFTVFAMTLLFQVCVLSFILKYGSELPTPSQFLRSSPLMSSK